MHAGPTAPTSCQEDCRSRRWGYGLLVLLALAIGVIFAYHRVFSASFAHDEGYLMITIRSFLDGHALYDTVFTQYGPFYYTWQGMVRGLLGVPLTHDATRLLCGCHWLASAAVLGLAGGMMMRSVCAGVFVFLQALVQLTGLANEPGHPQEIITLLLGAGLLVAARDTPPAHRFERLAAIAAMLVLIKINVGVLFGLALFLTLRREARDRFARVPWTWLLMAACVSLPFVLMRRHLSAEWCRNYAAMAACAITGSLLVAARRVPDNDAGRVSYLRIAAFFFVSLTAFLSVALLTGTSVHGLLDGLILTPLRTPTIALLPIPLANSVLVNAVIAMGAAVFYSVRPGWIFAPRVVPVLQGCYGLIGAFWLAGKVGPQFAYLLPWVWLILAGSGEGRNQFANATFPRVFLCLSATWQGLQAYPIAGTQITVATLLLVLVYALCLHDALKAAMEHLRALRGSRGPMAPQTVRLAFILAALGFFHLVANVWCDLPGLRRHYASLTQLNLRGSKLVRMDPLSAATYRELAAYLEAGCDTFITYPGYNSLYFWSDRRPPTHLNSNGWGLLTHAQQNQILAAVREARRPMIVVWASVAENWSKYIPPPINPIGRFVLDECREVKRIGPFAVFVLRRGG